MSQVAIGVVGAQAMANMLMSNTTLMALDLSADAGEQVLEAEAAFLDDEKRAAEAAAAEVEVDTDAALAASLAQRAPKAEEASKSVFQIQAEQRREAEKKRERDRLQAEAAARRSACGKRAARLLPRLTPRCAEKRLADQAQAGDLTVIGGVQAARVVPKAALQSMRMRDAGCAAIAEALKMNETLTSLECVRQRAGVAAAGADAARARSLSGNAIGPSGVNALIHALGFNKELNLSLTELRCARRGLAPGPAHARRAQPGRQPDRAGHSEQAAEDVQERGDVQVPQVRPRGACAWTWPLCAHAHRAAQHQGVRDRQAGGH